MWFPLFCSLLKIYFLCKAFALNLYKTLQPITDAGKQVALERMLAEQSFLLKSTTSALKDAQQLGQKEKMGEGKGTSIEQGCHVALLSSLLSYWKDCPVSNP